jgi:hypothetical protein
MAPVGRSSNRFRLQALTIAVLIQDGKEAVVDVRDWQGVPSLPPTTKASILPIMTLKSASVLALVGTLLLTVLAAADFINIVSGYLRGIVPAVALLRSLIYLLGGNCVTVFFFVFAGEQGR